MSGLGEIRCFLRLRFPALVDLSVLFNSVLYSAAILKLQFTWTTDIVYLKHPTDFWKLQGSDLVELFSQIPKGAINKSVLELGKGRAWVQEVIETVYLQSALRFLTTLKHYFPLLGCFMLFPSFFWLSLPFKRRMQQSTTPQNNLVFLD